MRTHSAQQTSTATACTYRVRARAPDMTLEYALWAETVPVLRASMAHSRQAIFIVLAIARARTACVAGSWRGSEVRGRRRAQIARFRQPEAR